MDNKKEKVFSVDDKHDFMPVICETKKPNGHLCNSFLGEIEVSRPNISKHHCPACRVTYRHVVNEDGMVEYDTTDDITLNTNLIAKVRCK